MQQLSHRITLTLVLFLMNNVWVKAFLFGKYWPLNLACLWLKHAFLWRPIISFVISFYTSTWSFHLRLEK